MNPRDLEQFENPVRIRRCNRPAFTVVEMMLVVVILSIIALMAMPMLRADEQTQLQAAARLLIADFAFAQTETIAHPDDPYALKFDTSTETYTVVHDATPPFSCAGASTVTDPATQQPYVTQYGSGRAQTLDRVAIDSVSLNGDTCLLFESLGQTDQTTAATVTLSAASKTITISVDPDTGEATTP